MVYNSHRTTRAIPRNPTSKQNKIYTQRKRERERDGESEKEGKKEKEREGGRRKKKAQLHCTALYSQPSLGHSMEFSAHIEDGSFPESKH